MSDTKTVLSFLRDNLCEFICKLPRDDYNTLRVWHHKAADLIEAQQAQRDELLAALEKLLAQFDSEIRSEYEGASVYASRLAEADHARAALSKVKP